MNLIGTSFKSIGLCLLSFTLILSACKKRGEYEVPCKIEQFTDDEGRTAHFAYNNWGDPVSLIQDQPTTGKPHLHFKYDSQHRLISLLGTYADSALDHYYKYKYNSNQYIVSDTLYYSGWGNPDKPSSWYGYLLDFYTYDNQGRIVRIDTKVGGTTIEYSTSYAYDGQGNLIKDGYTYDNKVSFLRTSLVLAFVARNYSMNNPTTAVSYNAKKLPTSFSYTDYNNKAIFLNHTISSISYTCDQSGNY